MKKSVGVAIAVAIAIIIVVSVSAVMTNDLEPQNSDIPTQGDTPTPGNNYSITLSESVGIKSP